MAKAHFRPALFKFMKELVKNNEKEWFDANRERYEAEVREPTSSSPDSWHIPRTTNLPTCPRRCVRCWGSTGPCEES